MLRDASLLDQLETAMTLYKNASPLASNLRPFIIGVSGQQLSGKSTVSHLLSELLGHPQVVEISDPIRRAWVYSRGHRSYDSFKKSEEGRKILLDRGAYFRELDINLLPLIAFSSVTSGIGIISGIRTNLEVNKLSQLAGGYYHISVDAPEHVRASRGPLHYTDHSLEKYLEVDASYIIDNDNDEDQTESLERQLEDMIHHDLAPALKGLIDTLLKAVYQKES